MTCGCPSSLNVPPPNSDTGCLSCVSQCCNINMCPPPHCCSEVLLTYDCGTCPPRLMFNSNTPEYSDGFDALKVSSEFGNPPTFAPLSIPNNTDRVTSFYYGYGSEPCPKYTCHQAYVTVYSGGPMCCLYTSGNSIFAVGAGTVSAVGYGCGGVVMINGKYPPVHVTDGSAIVVTIEHTIRCCSCKFVSLKNLCVSSSLNLEAAYWRRYNGKLLLDPRKYIEKLNATRKQKVAERVYQLAEKRGYALRPTRSGRRHLIIRKKR